MTPLWDGDYDHSSDKSHTYIMVKVRPLGLKDFDHWQYRQLLRVNLFFTFFFGNLSLSSLQVRKGRLQWHHTYIFLRKFFFFYSSLSLCDSLNFLDRLWHGLIREHTRNKQISPRETKFSSILSWGYKRILSVLACAFSFQAICFFLSVHSLFSILHFQFWDLSLSLVYGKWEG